MMTIEPMSAKPEKEAWEAVKNLLAALDFSKDVDYFYKCIFQSSGDRVVLVARGAQGPVGLSVINFTPSYPMFKRLGIPEIQDLNVLPACRGQGIGTALVAAAEQLARTRGATQIGIGVGLTSNYGAAQRLYVQLGYRPDGAGISDDGNPVRVGDMRAIDDNLCLYLVRDL